MGVNGNTSLVNEKIFYKFVVIYNDTEYMLLQFIINGLISGILYSLLAIGFALVYNTTRIFHIAAAALYVISAYGFWFFAVKLGISAIPAAIAAVFLTMGVSLLIEQSVYKPLKKKKASSNVIMVASIGVMTVLVNLIAIFFGNETKVIDKSISNAFVFGKYILTIPQLYQACIGTVLLIFFFIFLSFTNFGLKIRAVSDNKELYESLGCNSNSLQTLVFLLSGAMIGAASCLAVYDVGLNPNMGMGVLINAMVAMIIGGCGRFGTCVIGGLVLGVLQSLTVFQFASNWQNAITFIILLLLLFLRPQGIAGYKQRTV